MFLTGMLLSSMEVCNLLLLSLPGLPDHFSPAGAQTEAVSKQAQHQLMQPRGFEPSTVQETYEIKRPELATRVLQQNNKAELTWCEK